MQDTYNHAGENVFDKPADVVEETLLCFSGKTSVYVFSVPGRVLAQKPLTTYLLELLKVSQPCMFTVILNALHACIKCSRVRKLNLKMTKYSYF